MGKKPSPLVTENIGKPLNYNLLPMLVVPVLFIILGIAIKYGKMYFLIAGYNTMPKKKQANYDIKGIANLFKNAMFGMALLMILGWLISEALENDDIKTYAFFIALAIGIPYMLIRSNSSKFKIDKDQ